MDLATVDHLLTSTRSVRRRLDLTRSVEPDVIEKCLEIAVQAPTGGNLARYHFVVVTDLEARSEIANLYRRSYFDDYLPRRRHVQAPFPEREERMFESASYLAEHLHEVPVHIIPCFEGRVEQKGAFSQASMYGCVLPMAWSLMLALRARGIGSSWTTLHLMHEKQVAKLLGIPETTTQTALLPVAYFVGEDFSPARRVPARQRTYWNKWDRLRDA